MGILLLMTKERLWINFKLIAVDLDGTLLNSHSKISQKNLSAIGKLKESGIYFVPCTGRTLSEIPVQLKDNPNITYIIHSNGSVVFNTKTKERILNTLSKELAKNIFEIISDYKAHITIRYNCYCYVEEDLLDENVISYYNIFYGHVDVVKNYAFMVKDFNAWKFTLDDIEVVYIFFHNEEERQDAIRRLSKYSELLVVSIADFNIEIINVSAGKGNAIISLAKMLNIDKKETAGLGDSGNDLPVMKVVGIPIAVSNGTAELKSVCKEIICSNDEDAIDYIYNNFVKLKKHGIITVLLIYYFLLLNFL